MENNKTMADGGDGRSSKRRASNPESRQAYLEKIGMLSIPKKRSIRPSIRAGRDPDPQEKASDVKETKDIKETPKQSTPPPLKADIEPPPPSSVTTKAVEDPKESLPSSVTPSRPLEVVKEKESHPNSSSRPSSSSLPMREGICWKRGFKLEASDGSSRWYSAKILKVNSSKAQVLIHFEGWASRFDSWFPLDSSSLRPSQGIETESTPPSKSVRSNEYSVGMSVLARWTDNKKYPARIAEVFDDGSLFVIFSDGYQRKLRPGNVKKMPRDYSGPTISGVKDPSEALPPNLVPLNALAPKEFKVETDHNQFKCRVEGCGKQFRKEKLLESHVKHYHPELRPKKVRRVSGTDVSTEATSSQASSRVNTPEGSRTEGSRTESPVTPKSVETEDLTPLTSTEKEKKKTKRPSPLKIKRQPSELDSMSSTEKPRRSSSSGLSLKVKLPSMSSLPSKRPQYIPSLEEDSDSDTIEDVLSDKSSDETMTGDEVVEETGPPKKKRRRDLMDFSRKSSRVTEETHVRLKTKHPFLSRSACIPSKDQSNSSHWYYEVVEASPNNVLPFWDARTVREIHESDEVDELLHCICDLKEESGLMIQCEVCLTWQHGMCFGIDVEEEVPESYVCFACRNPRLVRKDSSRAVFAWDQDWIKKGRMVTLLNDKESSPQMKMTNQLLGLVREVCDVIHSLRFKLNILMADPPHDQLKLWTNPWPSVVVEAEEEEEVFPVPSTSMDVLGDIISDSKNILEKPSAEAVPDDLEKIDLISFLTSTSSPALDNLSSFKEADPDGSLTEEEKEVKKCKNNLRRHIKEVQEKVLKRLVLIESKVKQLETDMGYDGEDGAEQDLIAFKDEIKGFYRDLDSLVNITRL